MLKKFASNWRQVFSSGVTHLHRFSTRVGRGMFTAVITGGCLKCTEEIAIFLELGDSFRMSGSWSIPISGPIWVCRGVLLHKFCTVLLSCSAAIKWDPIKMQMRCAALLPLCILYLGSRLRSDTNSELRDFDYTSWEALCARHLLRDAHKYQRLWFFSPILCEMIKALNLFLSPGCSSNADELRHPISVIKAIDRSATILANSRRLLRWRLLLSLSSGRLVMAGNFVDYSLRSCDTFVTKLCFSREL